MGEFEADQNAYSALLQLVNGLRRRLAAEGITPEVDPDLPPAEQYERLQEELFETLARCRHGEEAMRSRQEQLQAFITQMPFAVAMFDCQMRYLAVSRRWMSDYRLGERSIIGESHYSVFPEVSDAWKAIHRRCLEGVSARSDGEAFLRADGTVDWVRWEVVPWYAADGSIGGMIIFSENITEQRLTEMGLRESEERLRTVLRTLPVGVMVTDPSGRVIETNGGVEGIYGGTAELPSSPQEYRIGKAWWGENGQPIMTGKWPSDIALRTGKAVMNQEIEIERADGLRVTVLDSAAPLRDTEGQIIGSVVVMQDITDRKQAEQALRESEERFSALANNISQLAWMADASGWIFWYNRRWYEYTGTTPEQMEGWGWQRVHDPDVLPRVLEEWQKSIATGEPFDMEFPLLGADGRFRPFLTRVFPVRNGEGHIVYWFGTNTDISEIRKAQDELLKLNRTLEQRVRERTAALEATNRELEAFSYSVSHDLRAPLRSIDGFSRILQERYAEQLDAAGQDYLTRVRASAVRMNRLIDDMLRLSRIGRAEMHIEPVDLSELAASVVEELHEREPERQVQVDIQPGLEVTGDAGLLRIGLENLLGNAWKFTGKTAEARIEVGAMMQDGERVYFVRDDGAGFDMRYADKLFSPFQRLHTEEEFPGTGIGLAIVQRIIARHGGRVWAESEEGKGATFYFTLP